jgi:hypothetical protein
MKLTTIALLLRLLFVVATMTMTVSAFVIPVQTSRASSNGGATGGNKGPCSSVFFHSSAATRKNTSISSSSLHARKSIITDERRKQLGLGDEDEEYDLDKALENNTDPFITKIIAGSFIIAMVALLIVGVVIPSTTDYGEGVCNPIVTAGRC